MEHDIGLYVHDVTESEDKYTMYNESKLNQVSPYSFINTIDNNKSHFIKCDIEQAKQARELYASIGRSSMQTYIYYLDMCVVPIKCMDRI